MRNQCALAASRRFQPANQIPPPGGPKFVCPPVCLLASSLGKLCFSLRHDKIKRRPIFSRKQSLLFINSLARPLTSINQSWPASGGRAEPAAAPPGAAQTQTPTPTPRAAATTNITRPPLYAGRPAATLEPAPAPDKRMRLAGSLLGARLRHFDCGPLDSIK